MINRFMVMASALMCFSGPVNAQQTARWEGVDFSSNVDCGYVYADSSSNYTHWDMSLQILVTFNFNFTQSYNKSERQTRRVHWDVSTGASSIETKHYLGNPTNSYGQSVHVRSCNGPCGITRASKPRESCNGART